MDVGVAEVVRVDGRIYHVKSLQATMQPGGKQPQKVEAGSVCNTAVMKTRADCGTRPQHFRAGWGGLDYQRREKSPKENIQRARLPAPEHS